jgi:cysteinyl-tRNA synthetase, unknown class
MTKSHSALNNHQSLSPLRHRRLSSAFLAAAICFCGAMTGCPDDSLKPNADKSFLYILQPDEIPFNDLATAGSTYLVLEPSRDGSTAAEFSSSEIAQIKNAGPCTKTVLAYLSIGEAEQARDYWQPGWVNEQREPVAGVAPEWLGPSNPDFPDNYKVRYWDAEWQSLLFGTTSGADKTPLDRIIDAGFDGVYLDIVDAYEFWSDEDLVPELTRMEARKRMIDLMESIAAYARNTRGASAFLVFPQNAAEIIRDDDGNFDAETDRYFSIISGIGQEDLFYDELATQDAAFTSSATDNLSEFESRGKIVLVSDYVIATDDTSSGENDARVKDFIDRTRALGFIPFAAIENRELNSIVVLDSANGWSSVQPVACE